MPEGTMVQREVRHFLLRDRPVRNDREDRGRSGRAAEDGQLRSGLLGVLRTVRSLPSSLSQARIFLFDRKCPLSSSSKHVPSFAVRAVKNRYRAHLIFFCM